MSFRDLLSDASELVNDTLGDSCVYEQVTGDVIPDVKIIVDRNKPVRDDFNILIGYQVEVSILKSEVPHVKTGDEFETPEYRYRISQITKETSAKYYCQVIEV